MAVKKKILIVNNFLQGGGVEKLMYDLVWHWHERYDITIMTEDFHNGAEELFPPDVSYIHEKVKKEYRKNIIEKIFNKFHKKWHRMKLQKFMKEKQFDMAIAMKDGWMVRNTARLDIPVKYAWMHTDYHGNYYTYEVFGTKEQELECMKSFKKIVCVAESIKSSIIDVIGDPGNLVVRYNPIDVEAVLEKAKEPVVDLEPAKEGVVRFVCVGRLNHQKGYGLLLEAAHMLEQEGYAFEVFVVGGKEPWGDEAHRLEHSKKRLGVRSVTFLGGRKNPYKYMKMADWMLSTSIFEGYSLVSQEAAVLDVPLLLTECSGVRELLGDSEYGIVMEPSVIGIYEGMKRVIEHPELQQQYKEKIMERKQIIGFEERIRDIEALLEEA